MAQRSGMHLTESHTEAVQFVYSIDSVLFQGVTPFQHVNIVEVPRFGKSLFLDHKIQSSQLDEFIFHESMVHPAMITHPEPKKVAIAGGGEGASLRDALRHKSVQAATMVDIDEKFVDIAKEHLPEWHQGSFQDPRSTLIYADARRWLQSNTDKFDVILSDLTDPLEAGPAVYLFTKDFYSLAFDALNDDGILAIQAGCANNNSPYLFVSLIKTLREVFPFVRPYWAFVTTFLMPWGFILASKKHDPLELSQSDIAHRLSERGITNTRYYSPVMHHGMFALPPYIEDGVKEYGRVLTDSDPFYWQT
ncbi:MAG: polyamine aminopropyltransferase [bacterium]